VKLFWILALVTLVVVFTQYYFDSSPGSDGCTTEPLPYCADTSRTGSDVRVRNNCEFDITVQWEFLAGKNQLHDLAPGQQKQISSFPLKIQSVSCCPEYNRCW
jgi:hypothetical protein